MQFPEKLIVEPVRQPVLASVTVPGSKSITNRALVLAALASHGGDCELRGALPCEDTEVMVAALRSLGFCVYPDWDSGVIGLLPPKKTERVIPAESADLFVGNSGTSMRFLTALVALGRGEYRLDGVTRMRERPLEDLLVALRQLGVDARSEDGNGRPPVVVRSNGLSGGEVAVRGDVSSQFLSGLLMAAPYATHDVEITVDGPMVSTPYVDMTVSMMRQFNVGVASNCGQSYDVAAGQRYSCGTYDIEPDASSASYFWAAAAITGGEVEVSGLSQPSLQGDMRFLDVLEDMGCDVVRGPADATVYGGALHGVDVDMNDISDTVMTLGAVACFAAGPTTIRNVGHIRHKESDRLAALSTELRRLGAGVEEFADGLTITPRPLHGAEVETYNDHRMAMSLALVGLRVPGVVIRNPGCVAKTYPGFFTDLERLR